MLAVWWIDWFWCKIAVQSQDCPAWNPVKTELKHGGMRTEGLSFGPFHLCRRTAIFVSEGQTNASNPVQF